MMPKDTSLLANLHHRSFNCLTKSPSGTLLNYYVTIHSSIVGKFTTLEVNGSVAGYMRNERRTDVTLK